MDVQEALQSPDEQGQVQLATQTTDPQAEPAGYESDSEEEPTASPSATAIARGGEAEKGKVRMRVVECAGERIHVVAGAAIQIEHIDLQ